MARKSRSSGRKKPRVFNAPAPPPSEPPKPNVLKRFLLKTWKFILVLGAIAGLLSWIGVFRDINNLFKSEQEKYEDENFVKGILLPSRLIENNQTIDIVAGGATWRFPVWQYKEGVPFKVPFFNSRDDNNFGLELRIRNNYLQFSTTFKDLQKEEVVGIINFNRWSLFKPNLLNWQNNDTALEVIDRANNVIFSAIFRQPNTLAIKGYVIGPQSATCWNKILRIIPKIQPHWRDSLLAEVQKTEPIFKY